MAVNERDPALTQEKGVQERKRPHLGWIIPPLSLAGAFYLGQIAKDEGFDLTIIQLPWDSGSSSGSHLLKANPETIDQQISNIDWFLSFKGELQDVLKKRFSFSEARLSQLSSAVNFIDSQAKKFLREGVIVARLALSTEEAVNIYETRNGIVIDGEEYKLDSVFERSVAAAILELKMNRTKANFKAEKETSKVKQTEEVMREHNASGVNEWASQSYRLIESSKAEEVSQLEGNIEILVWLKKKGLDITVDRDAWAILESRYLLVLSKAVKVLEEHNLPSTLRFRFVRHKPGMEGGGWYQPHNHREPFTVVVTNNSDGYASVHEIGHFLSDAHHKKEWEERMRPFSQEEFNNFVWGRPRGANKEEIRRDEEEHAEGFKDYIFNGQVARERGSKLDYGDNPLTEQREKIYAFMHKMLGKSEFIDFGEKIVTNDFFEPGRVVLVSDPDGSNTGYLLRKEASTPEWDISPDLRAVFRGDILEILERRIVSVSRRGDGRADREMLRVRVLNQLDESRERAGYTVDAVGWIDAGAVTPVKTSADKRF